MLSPSSLGRLAKPSPLSFPLKFVLRVFSCLFDCLRCVKPGSRPQGRGPCFMQWRAFVRPDGACGFTLSCVTHLGSNIFAIAYCHSSPFDSVSENRGLQHSDSYQHPCSDTLVALLGNLCFYTCLGLGNSTPSLLQVSRELNCITLHNISVSLFSHLCFTSWDWSLYHLYIVTLVFEIGSCCESSCNFIGAWLFHPIVVACPLHDRLS